MRTEVMEMCSDIKGGSPCSLTQLEEVINHDGPHSDNILKKLEIKKGCHKNDKSKK